MTAGGLGRVDIGRNRKIAAPPFCFSLIILGALPDHPRALPVIPAKAGIHNATNPISAARLTTSH